MKYYLTAKQLDITSGEGPICIINEKDAEEFSVHAADRMQIDWNGANEPIVVDIDTTDSIVAEGEIGVYEDIWKEHDINQGEVITLELLEQSVALKSIRKKLLGEKLNYEDFFNIMKDISNGRLDDILIAFFIASGYSPGLDYEEILEMTKALAETGVKLEFDGIVADKHSIGGIAGKGVTPLVVPIVAANDVVVPNTSTRAITSASATTDMLEVIMPMSFTKRQLEQMVEKNGVFMVWGGALDLAPADDLIINIQKKLGIESVDKFVSSIMAKKIAQGITHVIFDVPIGEVAKIKEEKFPEVEGLFKKLGEVFGIKVEIFRREVKGIDGFAVGPSLECREFLRVYEQHPERSQELENTALNMAGVLLESVGKAPAGKGYALAKATLLEGKAVAKFRSIVEAQGGDPNISSEGLEFGDQVFDYKAAQSGVIDYINNKAIFEVAKALGNPRIKEAGIFLYKFPGDEVKSGDVLAKLYATSANRLELGKKAIDQGKVFEFVE